jgi:hypothetical protein
MTCNTSFINNMQHLTKRNDLTTAAAGAGQRSERTREAGACKTIFVLAHTTHEREEDILPLLLVIEAPVRCCVPVRTDSIHDAECSRTMIGLTTAAAKRPDVDLLATCKNNVKTSMMPNARRE